MDALSRARSTGSNDCSLSRIALFVDSLEKSMMSLTSDRRCAPDDRIRSKSDALSSSSARVRLNTSVLPRIAVSGDRNSCDIVARKNDFRAADAVNMRVTMPARWRAWLTAVFPPPDPVEWRVAVVVLAPGPLLPEWAGC